MSDGGTSVITTFWLLPSTGTQFPDSFLPALQQRFLQGQVVLNAAVYGGWEYQSAVQLTAPPPPPPSESDVRHLSVCHVAHGH